MPYMNPPENFEPGETTKRLLLYVNKKEKNIPGTNWPGLIEDTHYAAILIFTFIALVLEWVGLFFIIDAIGIETEEVFMAIAAFVLLDVLFALALHWVKVGPVCFYENKILTLPLFQETNGLAKNQAIHTEYKGKITRAKVFGFILGLLIWTVAATKSFLFFSLVVANGGQMNSQVIFIFTSYMVVALIHVTCTGYALFGGFARLSWILSEKKYTRSQASENTKKIKNEIIVANKGLIPGQILNVGQGHVLEKLLEVDLIYRDNEGNAIVILSDTLKNELENDLVTNIKQRYIEQRKATNANIGEFAHEIQDEARNQIKAMIKLKIDTETQQGIFNDSLRSFLMDNLAVDDSDLQNNSDFDRNSILEKLAKGQCLYRMKASGLLLDNELVDFVGKAPNINSKEKIALHGLKLQMDTLGIQSLGL